MKLKLGKKARRCLSTQATGDHPVNTTATAQILYFDNTKVLLMYADGSQIYVPRIWFADGVFKIVERTKIAERFTDDEIRHIRQLRDDGHTNGEIAKMYNTGRSTISDIYCGNIYKHVE